MGTNQQAAAVAAADQKSDQEAAAVAAAAAMDTKDQTETQDTQPEAVMVALGSFKAVRYDSYNPFTKTHFEQGQVVENVIIDNWMKCQLAAGHIVKAE